MLFNKFINTQYKYDIYVSDVYDGDTITVDITLGFDVLIKKQKIRLFGINTPEVRGDDKEFGKKVRDYVRNKILHKNISMYSIKDKKGKYGRYLGIIYYNDNNQDICLNQELLDKEMAIQYML